MSWGIGIVSMYVVRYVVLMEDVWIVYYGNEGMEESNKRYVFVGVKKVLNWINMVFWIDDVE